jgi:hypothetical protein
MSRKLKELAIGTEVYIHETVDGTTAPKPYLVVRQKSNGITCLERVNAPGQRRMNPTNVTTYKESEMDAYLIDESEGFLARFSDALRACLRYDSIPTYSYGDSEPEYIARKCYLGSYGEFFLDDTQRTDVEPEDNDPEIAYQILGGTLTVNNARKCYDEAGVAVYCWLRSPYSAGYWYVNSSGTASGNNAISSYGFRPRLAVSSDTIVSDEDADIIYLVPEDIGYKEIKFKAIAGSRETKPDTGIAIFDARNLYDISAQICCNYGSEEEVWVDAPSGVDVAFPECVKTTQDWVVGFRFYGKSTTMGSIAEPEIHVY